MSAEPSYAALCAHDRRVAGMLADAECVGELLLVGVAMARSVDLGDPPWGDDGLMRMGVIADRVYGNRWLPGSLVGVGSLSDRADSHPRRRVRDLFRADRRRYRPEDHDQWGRVTCGRPMLRRAGLCDRSASERRQVTDPATGLREWVGACSTRACKEWLGDLLARNRAELAEHSPPTPAANTGGVLERHLPEIDWWKVWRAVDPGWSPPTEGRPFERPTLQLLVSDEPPAGSEHPVPVSRPVLVALEGGWR